MLELNQTEQEIKAVGLVSKNSLINGDCLEVMKYIPDNSIDMVMADPPYGITACKWDSIIPLEPMWKHLKRVIKPNGAIVMTASQPFTTTLISSNMEIFKYELIWEKTKSTGFLDCSYRPMRSHENILIFYEDKPTYNPQKLKGYPWVKGRTQKPNSCWGKQAEHYAKNESGERQPKSVMLIPNFNNSSLHPTQKPVALMAYLIKTYTNEGDTVLDFCCGSGTTGIACKRWGRNFILIEKEQKYCDIARRRLGAEENLFSEAVNNDN